MSMPIPERIVHSFETVGKALDQLGKVVAMEPDPDRIIIDSTIQRFEFTVELFWNHLKRLAVYSGADPKTPRETLQKAFSFGWINHEDLWLGMIYDRNITSHIYKEELANQIYNNIKKYYHEMKHTHDLLKRKFLLNKFT